MLYNTFSGAVTATNVPGPDFNPAYQLLLALDPDPEGQFGFRSINDRGDGPTVLYYGTPHRGIKQSKDPDKNGQPCSPFSRLAFLQRFGNGAFFTSNKLDGRGQTAASVIAIRTAFTDSDTAAAVEQLHRFIARSGLPPTALVASGGVDSGVEKTHTYWRLKGCPVCAFRDTQLTLVSRIGSDPAVCDPGHVTRPPGFWHLKGEPRRTRLLSIAPTVEYEHAEFMARVRAQPQICDPWGSRTARRTATRRGATTAPVSDGPRLRLRVLLDKWGGSFPAAIRVLMREAVAPAEGSAGNRHETLRAAVARLVGSRWSDADIRVLLLPLSDEWGDGDWTGHLDSIIDWTRKKQNEAEAAMPSAPSALARAFGAGGA